jgi:redox-sensitive bicupin YhaK (pirin superfamily)
MAVEIRRAAERFVTAAPGRVTRHSFSFGTHYDPANVSFAQLVCHNDDLVDPGFGYDDHPHRDVEIVTWVLSGALSHRDSSGSSGVTVPGTVQVMSAGDGIVHSETVEPGAGVTRFVQTWVRPDVAGGKPSYACANVAAGPGWTPLASGSEPNAATRIGSRGATLWLAEPTAVGSALILPESPLVHLFVAAGSVTLGAGPIGPDAGESPVLGEGDAVRLVTEDAILRVDEPSQLLAWTFA